MNWARALKHLDHEFSDSGTLAALCGASAFEPRPEQLEMAQAVATAQANRGISLIEAGTGIGKSFAYLIPSILFAKKTGHAVGVATRTNVLAHQLITSDLPRLAKEYKHGFSYLIAKGYNHYPSLEKIEALIRGNFDLKTIKTIRFSRSKVESEILTTIALVVSASCECSCVDVDNLGIRWNMLSRSWFVSTSRNESREHGAANQHFFIDELRQRARHTDILITNHALLLSDIACGHNIFPEINDWVVDEAHGFAEQAAATWTEETSAYAVAQALKQLGTHEHGLISDVVSHCASTNAAATLEKLAPQIEKASSSVLSGVEEAMQTLAALDLSKCPYAGNLGFGEKTISVRVYAELRESDAWLAFDQAIQDIQERLTELIKLLQQVLAALAFQKQFSKTLNLRAVLQSLQTFDAVTDRVCHADDKAYVSVLESNLQQPRTHIKIKTIPLSVAGYLQNMWYTASNSLVFTSATLTSQQSFTYFKQSLGVTRSEDHELIERSISSPFDYQHNMGLLIPTNLKEPGAYGYKEEFVDLLFDVHKAMDGSVLTLFTNKKDMQYCYDALKDRMDREGLDLLVQNKSGAQLGLMNKFKRDDHASLMGLKSFWEGIDAPGTTLRCVVIARLPFLSPHDPVCEALAENNPRSWWEYVLPHAIIEMRQAAGRLIRSQEDAGLVIIADTRILHKSYGKHMISSLPDAPVTQVNTERIAQYISMWRSAHKC